MATVSHVFLPADAVPRATNYATYDVVAGSNFPVPCLDFDGGSTDEGTYFFFRAVSYGSGNLTVRVAWYADTASSGNVVWGAQLAAITQDTDTQDIETKAFGAANTQQDSHLGTTDQRLHTCPITLSNTDSIAAGDWCCLYLYRDASDTTNDTMTGDANVVMVTVEYSDT